MGLQAVYEKFLQSPTPAALADNATLQYVTTLTSFAGGSRIIQHLHEQGQNVVRKKSENPISGVEGLTAVALVVETTLVFVSSGGAYLPGLDTFIIDKVAVLPIDDKITQIRLSWDQGDLLKQAEVIGTRGRNWPVYDGKEQIKMVTASTSTANAVNPAPTLSPRGRDNRSTNGNDRSTSPTKKYIRDPHASLDLSKVPEEDRYSAPNPVAPRESHKPPPREMSDLFAAGHEDYQPTGLSGSPKKVVKSNVVAPKGAGHQKYQQSRIFDEDEAPSKEPKIYKTNPARYNHFDIGDANDNDHFQHRDENTKPRDIPIRSDMPGRSIKKGQHVPQWDFEDFVTPEKVKQKTRDQDVVHFSYGDEQPQADSQTQQPGKARKDAEAHFEFQDNGTPVYQPNVPKPRKDANAHFDFTDEPTPGPRRIIARTEAANKLYADPVFPDEEEEQRPLATKSQNTRTNVASRWQESDDSITQKQQTARGGGPRGRRDADKSFWDF
ncbi:hypothetical protein LTR51_006309 [Lithohypha guttulata]|uniref:Uncharacterized protein n=1 Tax=Lithohypha guttulata TaxID=1690604 RepID=A0AAN7YJ91_9EURO|nr:hypothetical protein LTR51_006309 [Lithohypha guttulata]KAK5088514.1 hypothetical protein LTR05_002734 [Lithohypha guttulata]